MIPKHGRGRCRVLGATPPTAQLEHGAGADGRVIAESGEGLVGLGAFFSVLAGGGLGREAGCP
jgi:hypothetical protein